MLVSYRVKRLLAGGRGTTVKLFAAGCEESRIRGGRASDLAF